MENYSDIIAIIDRSGSMQSMQLEAIGAFNAFLEQQKALPDAAMLSLILFDHEYEAVYLSRALHDSPPLDESSYQPRGTTALLDAIGRSIDDISSRHEKLSSSEQPAQVIVCILTDGLENASQDYTQERIASMIRQKQAAKWEFVFLAANQDAFQTGARLNIAAANTFNYQATEAGTQAAFAKMSDSVRSIRSRKSL